MRLNTSIVKTNNTRSHDIEKDKEREKRERDSIQTCYSIHIYNPCFE